MSVEVIPGVVSNYPLRRMTTVRTGGSAEYFSDVGHLDDLLKALRWAKENGLSIAVVGSGSNLLISDHGVEGLVLHLSGELAEIKLVGESQLVCGGGARLPAVAAYAARIGLSGIEFGVNIPGTVGGAVKMNANAYGGQLAEVIESVSIMDADGMRNLTPDQLGFQYRESNLKSSEVVTEASFSLSKGDVATVKQQLARLRKQRREAQPAGIKTFGSTFKNPDPELAKGKTAGQLLAAAGCTELKVGDATFANKHANFVENLGNATTADVVQLMALGRKAVYRRFNILLEPEVQFFGLIELPPEWELGS